MSRSRSVRLASRSSQSRGGDLSMLALPPPLARQPIARLQPARKPSQFCSFRLRNAGQGKTDWVRPAEKNTANGGPPKSRYFWSKTLCNRVEVALREDF